jgi:tRNA threonylcarbamoyladenosine modification (KEOPS) complex  Pcc1 subunit
MNSSESFSLTSSVTFSFDDPHIRDYSYNSFLPEYEKFTGKRSEVIMKKEGLDKLLFIINSKDITAFRASMSDIISLGKIIESIESLTS